MSLTKKLDRKEIIKVIESKISINEKLLWKVDEACLATGWGENRIRELMNQPDVDFIIERGSRKYILREAFIQYFRRMAQNY